MDENTLVLSELTLTLKCNFIFSFVGFAGAVIHTGTTKEGGQQMATLSTTVLVPDGKLTRGISRSKEWLNALLHSLNDNKFKVHLLIGNST